MELEGKIEAFKKEESCQRGHLRTAVVDSWLVEFV
jgi:hypothetical protein